MLLVWTYNFVFFLFGTLLNFNSTSGDTAFSGKLEVLSPPTMTITAAEVSNGDTSNDTTLSLTFTASESASNFDASDVAVINGILSDFSGAGTTYTATFTPSSDGACTIEVLEGSFTDPESNPNVSSNQFNWSFDSTNPTISIAANEVISGGTSNDATLSLSFTTSENTSDFDASDVVVTNGILSDFSGSNTTYTATFTPSSDGACTIDVSASTFTDDASNTNTAASQFNWTSDSANPTISITANEVISGATSSDAALSLSFTTSENTSDFDVSDVAVTNGILSDFSGSGTTYTATFTPSNEGGCTIDVNASTFTDDASNNNTAATQFNWTFAAQTCNDPTACNYDASHTTSTNCRYLGDICDDNDPMTVKDKLDVNCNCIGEDAVVGCGDANACNYKEGANSPGPCLYEFTTDDQCWSCTQDIGQGSHGDGNGILQNNDINENGICDDEDIVGCMDATACNYNELATATSAFTNAPNPCIYPTDCDFCGIVDDNGVEYYLSENVAYDDENETYPSYDETNYLDIDESGNAVGGTALTQHKDYVLINGDKDGNATCDVDDEEGCTDSAACNYSADATIDNASCIIEGDCGCEDGAAKDLPEGDCDCNGNTFDEIGVCGGSCLADENHNGICDNDEVNGCIDVLACNYNSSANMDDGSCIYLTDSDCQCSGETDGSGTVISRPAGDCDCDGNQLDAIGVCGGSCEDDVNGNLLCDANENPGCTNPAACNYDATATLDTGGCQFFDECNECGGSGIPIGDCDCDGNQLDAIGQCLPSLDDLFCEADTNHNDICDIVEVRGCTDPNSCSFNPTATINIPSECLTYDACGVCGGSTLTLPEGYCDCDGHKEDAVGICGGHCESDTDQDGLCDDIDPCPNDSLVTKDICGVCGGPGAVFNTDTCGCFVIPTNVETCGCDQDVPRGKIQYPNPGYNCNDSCLIGYDEFGECIIGGDAVPTVLPNAAITAETDGNTLKISTNPERMFSWMKDIQTLHDRMSTNLDDGSLSGGSDTLTIDKAIIDNGDLVVSGSSDLGYLVVPDPDVNDWENDSVRIFTNLFVRGNARIKGTTFSDGGVNTTAIDLSGDMSIGGDLEVAGTVQLDSTLNVLDSLTVADAISIGTNHQVLLDSTGYVNVDSLVVRSDFQVGDSAILHRTLDVDSDFRVNHNKFYVQGSSGNITGMGTMNISQATTLQSTLDVNNNFRVFSGGIERFKVDASNGNATVQGGLTVTSTAALSNNATIGGTLDVDGTTELDGLNVFGPTTMDAITMVGNLTQTGNHILSGDLQINNSAGVTKFNVNQANGNTSISGNADITGILTTTANADMGGGATIGGLLNHTGNTFQSTARSFKIGSNASTIQNFNNYTLVIDGKSDAPSSPDDLIGTNGIAIRVNSETATNDNRFIAFFNRGGEEVGAILGERQDQFGNQKLYVHEITSLSIALAQETWNQVQAGKDVAEVSVEVATYAAAGVACVIPGAGLTDVDVAEGVAMGVSAAAAGAKVTIAAASLAERVAAVVIAAGALASFKSIMVVDQGVTYATGSSADYAEWLERENLVELFMPGQIVGIRGGKISKQTENAENLLIISTAPGILGNEPENKEDYEKVAFLGQVPVRIIGPVKIGDYILPTGDNDGYGIAVSPEDIRLNEITEIVGVAWEEGTSDLVNVVNASIGLDGVARKELVLALQKQMEELRIEYSDGFNSLQNQITSLRADMLASQGQAIGGNESIASQTATASIQKISYRGGNYYEESETPRAQAGNSQNSNHVDFQNLSLDETKRICQEEIMAALEQAAFITKEDEELTIQQFADGMAAIQEYFVSAAGSAQPDIRTLMPQKVNPVALDVTAKISMAALNIITHPENMRDPLRKALKKSAQQLESSGIDSNAIFGDFAEGSTGEELLLKKCKEVAEEQMLLMYPFMKRY